MCPHYGTPPQVLVAEQYPIATAPVATRGLV
jgi:hypothetical protein